MTGSGEGSLVGKRVAVIGAGAMGGALVRGVLGAGLLEPGQVEIFDRVGEKAAPIAKETGAGCAASAAEAAGAADVVIVAVKPGDVPGLLSGLGGSLRPSVLVVSIAAGITTGMVEDALGRDLAVVRVMPSTPALLGAGAAAVCRGAHATADDERLVLALFGAVGLAVAVGEQSMDAVTAVSGSGPA